MSRSNEIISMLGAGRSIFRILLPLMFVGVVLTGITAFFNYEGAPHASGIKKVIVGDIKRGHKSEKAVKGHLFRNREEFRTWFISRMPIGGGRMSDVQIVQQNSEGDIIKQWYAHEAVYDPAAARWKLKGARYVEMNPAGDLTKSELADVMYVDGWSETPWRIASSMMNADFPSARLAPYRTQWHYRWALPTVCFLVIFVAAPCGIVYSRRGVMGGVATAIGLFFGLVFVSSLFIALGKGSRVPPVVGAWGPMFGFFVIGLYMLWLRSTNRDLPKIKIPGLS
jgi:lipopolysaccharide export LptBFGC system permease protein LptF